jgi:hypothetical protein
VVINWPVKERASLKSPFLPLRTRFVDLAILMYTSRSSPAFFILPLAREAKVLFIPPGEIEDPMPDCF